MWDDWLPGGSTALTDAPEPEAALVASYEALVRPADDMVVIFSSGSRGAPKAVVHTHGGALGATQSGLGARLHRRG